MSRTVTYYGIYAAVSNEISMFVEKEHVFVGAVPLESCYSMGFLYAVQYHCVLVY